MKNLIFVALFVTSCASSNGEVVPWERFLNDPTEKNFRFAENIISSESRCNRKWYSKSEYSEYLSSLFNMISQGNEYSFKIGLLILDCLDGGNLGDAYRSIGLFFDNNSSYFSKIINNKTISDEKLKNMLIMLPLDTTDNIPKKIGILKYRIRALSNFKHSMDETLYSKVLSILTKELKFYQDLSIK